MNSALYVGRVTHRRTAPVLHAFAYPVYMTCLDLAELDQVFAGRWLWSTRRAAPVRFRRADHFGDPTLPLDESVRRLVHERTGRRPRGAITLLTNLRHFGYVFNPVSFYFCLDPGRGLDAFVAEVSNTPWGERHLYVFDARGRADGDGSGWFTFDQPKEFHVSPFLGMDYDYRFRVLAPGERLVVTIRATPPGDGPGSSFDAALALRRVPITGPVLARTLVRFPLMTARIVAAIHAQALRLWLKRVPVQPHPGGIRPARAGKHVETRP